MPYIDLSQSSNGSGTEVSPYNSFTEFQAASGDRGGEIWFVKRDVTYNGAIDKSNASNYKLVAYGGTNDPVINAAGESIGIYLQGDNIVLGNHHQTGANNVGIYIGGTTANNSKVIGCTSENVGSSPGNAFSIKPATLSTGIVVHGNIARDCTEGNAYEVERLSGAHFYGNFGSNCVQCYELWRDTIDSIFEQSRFENMTGRAWWIANGAGAYSDTFTGNICRNNQFLNVVKGWHVNADGAGSITASGNQFYHNSLVVSAWNPALDLGSGTAHKFVNNVVLWVPTGSNGVSNGIIVPAAAQVGSDINHNYYYLVEQELTDSGATGRINKYNLPKFYDGSTTYQNGNSAGDNPLSRWATGTGLDTHSWGGSAGGVPFVDYLNGDLRLVDGEVLYDASKTTISTVAPEVESGLITVDYNRIARYGDNDPGALQYVRNAPQTTSVGVSD